MWFLSWSNDSRGRLLGTWFGVPITYNSTLQILASILSMQYLIQSPASSWFSAIADVFEALRSRSKNRDDLDVQIRASRTGWLPLVTLNSAISSHAKSDSAHLDNGGTKSILACQTASLCTRSRLSGPFDLGLFLVRFHRVFSEARATLYPTKRSLSLN